MTTTALPKLFGLLALNVALQNSSKLLKKALIGSNHSLTNLAITEFFSSYCKTKRNFLIKQQISQTWLMCQTSEMKIKISPKLNVDWKYTMIAKTFDRDKKKILTNHCSSSLYLWISRKTD